MEKRKKKALIALGVICLLGLGYFILSRYLVSKLDGTGRVSTSSERVLPDPIRMLFVGDVMLDRTVRNTLEREGFEYVFGSVKSLFEDADIAIGNLEGSITENVSISQKDHDVLRFTFATSTASQLKELSFTGFTLANNHALDFGEFGLDDTEHYLTKAGLYFFGSPYNDRGISSMPVVKDERVCLLGYHALYNSSINPVIAEINESRSFCDYTIVFAHWGEEYESEPGEEQRKIGHAFIDAGANLVIGSHPHVVEPIEIYRGKAIFYSLGNFIFDQDFSLATRQGLAVRLELSSTTQVFRLTGLEMYKNRLYFPEKEAYEPSMDVILSELPAELRRTTGVDGEFVLPR